MKVAFICSGVNSTPFSEFIPFSKFLNSEGIETLFLLDNFPSPNVIKALDAENRNYYCEALNKKKLNNDTLIEQPQSPSKLSFLKNIFPFNILKNYISGLRNYKAAINKLTGYEKIARNFFLSEKPDCIILYGDRNLNIVPPAIKYAKDNNIPIIVLQVAAAVKSILLHARQGNVENSDALLINKFLKKRFPQQWSSHGEDNYSFYSWHLTLALLKLKMLPSNPWIDGDSWADKHLLISPFDLQVKKNEGSLCRNTSIVGQYSHDLLYDKFVNREETKTGLNKKYFNNNGKEIIVFGFPQFWEHNLMSKERAFKEIEVLVNALSKLNDYNILVSLHPKMAYENYKKFEETSPNLKIAQNERLSNILPSGAIFLSIFESTISWALLCNVVPVYLDLYGYGFSLKNTSGCVVIDDKTSLELKLDDITSNLNKYKSALNSQENKSLPPFDGNSGRRILTEIKSLINNSNLA